MKFGLLSVHVDHEIYVPPTDSSYLKSHTSALPRSPRVRRHLSETLTKIAETYYNSSTRVREENYQ